MYFPGPGGAQQIHDPSAGGAPDNGVIDEDDALALHLRHNGAQLHPHQVHSVPLARRDEGPANVAVFEEAQAKGDPGRLGVAQGRVQTGVRHPHHQIRLHRVSLCQKHTGFFPGLVDPHPVHDGVGPGKVDVLKDAHGLFRFAAMAPVAADTGLVHGDDLSRQQIPEELCPHSPQGAALRGKDGAAVLPDTHTQRPESMGIPQGNEFCSGHQDHGKSPL